MLFEIQNGTGHGTERVYHIKIHSHVNLNGRTIHNCSFHLSSSGSDHLWVEKEQHHWKLLVF